MPSILTKNRGKPRDLYTRATLNKVLWLPGTSAGKGMFSGIKQDSRVRLAEGANIPLVTLARRSRSGKLPLSKLTEDNQSPLPE